jgi:predicted transcriptional regulator
MLSSDQAIRILQYCEQNTPSVSEILAELGGRYETTIGLIKELSAWKLVKVTREKKGVGRPKNLIQTTPLGKQFIEQHNRLLGIRLRSNDNDIRRALKQAAETQRLLELGIDPYVRFQEVNEIVRNIANTSQIGKHS